MNSGINNNKESKTRLNRPTKEQEKNRETMFFFAFAFREHINDVSDFFIVTKLTFYLLTIIWMIFIDRIIMQMILCDYFRDINY